MSEGPAVVLHGLRKSFGSKLVLRGLSFEVAGGETFTLLGGSGSGKSVCLRHIIGLLEPDAGAVEVLGQPLAELDERGHVELRKRCGMVFQGAALFDSLTVYENVAYPIREHREWPEERIGARVRECLAAVGLPGIEGVLPGELSGGMRKRVGVARAIALEPELILYDEPTTGLDPANAKRVGELIRALQQQLRVTSVVVTHDLELCFTVSDRIALLKGGDIAVVETVEAFRDSEHPEVRAYFEGVYDEGEGGTQPDQEEA